MQQQNVIASVENANETAERQADKHVEALFR
jgi:hypothetical protein